MASNFGLSIPEPSTPTKSMTASTDNLSLSSPSSIKSGSDSSIINTGGIPIATLRTPTKGSSNQNIAPKQPIMMSPPKLYIKGNLGGIRGTSVAQLIQTTSTGAGAGQTPVYQAVSNGQNGRVQYVKLVTDSSSGAIPTRQIITQVRPLQQKVVTSVAAAASTGTQQQFIQQNIQSATGTQIRPATTVIRQQSAAATPVGQRVILPAATPHQTIRITGTQSLAHIKSQLPIGATILSSNDSSGQMLAFLPNNQSLIQQKTPVVKQVYPGSGASSHPTSRLQEIRHESLLHQQHTPTAETPPTHLQIPPTTSSDVKQKKPCNCTKSQCLKLYCDCFANGEFCSNCNCQNCFNNLEHEEERQKAVKQCLDRNPQAFHPKIGKGTKTDGRRHQKGCNCKRSGCLKNYCECFEAKIPCGSICKCVGCKNNESADSKSLMSLADAADMRHSQAVAAGNHRLPYHDIQQPAVHNAQNPHAYLKKDVIGAIMDCLIAQCREAESAKCNESTTEKVILEEFGRCLNDVIKASAQQTKPY